MTLYSKRFLRNVLVTKRVPRSIKNLPKLQNRAFSEHLEIGKLKDLFESHPRPANTDKIVVPKVNSEIWATLSARAKQRDAKALQVQRTIVHSTFCVLEAVKDVLELENEHIKEKVVKNLTDAVHMFGLTNYDLSLKRRHAMKFELSPDPMVASALCAPEVKVTEFLFGKDVAKTTSKAKSVAYLKKSFGRPKNVQGGAYRYRRWQNEAPRPFYRKKQNQDRQERSKFQNFQKRDRK